MSKTINELPLASDLDPSTDLTLVYDVSEGITKKANLGQFVSTHTHVISDVTGLQDALDNKAGLNHNHTASAITNFNEAAQDAVGAIVDSTLTYDDANNSLGVADNTSTQKVEVALGGSLVGTRKKVNFIQGSNVTLTVEDDNVNDEVDVTISAESGGSPSWGSITGTLSNQTDLQTALNAKQNADAELSAIAGLTSAADRVPYFTGSGTAALATLTSFGRSLIDDASSGAARTTLGLGTIATQAANSVNITGGSISNITDLAIADGGTGASTAENARTNLGLGTAAVLNAGTSANNVVQLDGSARLPAVDGSQLTNLPSGGTNVVKQIKQTVKSDTWGGSTANTWMDVTGLSLTITPSSALHKILINCDISIQYTTATALNGTRSNVGVRLIRDTTEIALGNINGSKIRATKNVGLENNELENVSFSFIDSPNTTSAITYKIQVFVPNTTSPVLRVNFAANSADVVGISTLTATEFEDV